MESGKAETKEKESGRRLGRTLEGPGTAAQWVQGVRRCWTESTEKKERETQEIEAAGVRQGTWWKRRLRQCSKSGGTGMGTGCRIRYARSWLSAPHIRLSDRKELDVLVRQQVQTLRIRPCSFLSPGATCSSHLRVRLATSMCVGVYVMERKHDLSDVMRGGGAVSAAGEEQTGPRNRVRLCRAHLLLLVYRVPLLARYRGPR